MLKYARDALDANRNDFFEFNDIDTSDRDRMDDFLKIVGLPTPMTCFTNPSMNLRDSGEALLGFANVAIIQGTRRRALLFPTYFGLTDIATAYHKSHQSTLQAMFPLLSDLTDGVSVQQHSQARAAWKDHLSLDDQDIFDVDVSDLMTHGGGPHCLTKQYQFAAGEAW